MDSRVANQFILACIDIFKQVGNVTLKKTGLEYFPTGHKISAEIATILGVTGALQGQFIIAMDESIAMKIASAILMGEPVTTYNEIAASAVSEIGNMIGGKASTLLLNAGYICDLTVPTIVRGKEMAIAFYPVTPMFIIHFSCEWGLIHLTLRFRSKEN